jgi:penicillin-binding protein 1C
MKPPNLPRRSIILLILAFIASLPLIIAAIAGLHALFDIRFTNKQPSVLLFDRSYKFIAAIENTAGEFGYWEMPDTLPKNLVTATLAAEDRRFNGHFGIDFRSIARAFVDNYVHRKGYSGASTIAMQVARLQRGGGGGWYYKVHDAVAGLGLTVFHGRSRVLRQYFRIAPYGNKIAGAACASRRYFHKSVQDLSLAEAALLASIPKAPSRFNLFDERGLGSAKRRARRIITRAFDYGWISRSVQSESLAELATLSCPVKELRNESCFHFIHAFAKRLGKDSTVRGEIRSTLDLALQDTLQSILGRNLPRLLKWEAGNSAAMVVDVNKGEVMAYIGSYNYYDPRGGAIDCATLPRSTGSLLKPFIYALGMEWQGYTSATVLTDLGFDFGTGRHSYVPENFDRRFMGPVLYKCALANSRNIPAVQVLKAVGVDMFYSKCNELGLAPDDGMAPHYGLGLSIGGLYCSLQQVCGAYLILANNGEKRDLAWEINNKIPVPGRQIIPRDIAMQIKRYLSDPVARLPSFPRGGNMEYPFAVAVKTGTSEGFRDSWCIGFSDRYLVGVWMGNTDFSTTKSLSGYEGAARIVKEVLNTLHPDKTDGLSDVEFPPPPGYVPVQICRLTGKKADRFTPFATTEYFKPGTEPLEYSTVQQLLSVDKRNGLLAYPGCNAPLEYRRFIVLAPAFRDWAESQGLEVPPDRYSPACGNAPIVDNYAIAITSPRSGSRFFIDPEMPEGKSVLPFICGVSPIPASVMWLVNGEEYKVVPYPFKLLWPMKPGKYEFQATVPETPFKSKPVTCEVY